jgi:hypothetical protein
MAKKYNVIFMANDGEYVIDSTHSSEEECTEIINNIGSKWFFYPIPFIIEENKIIWAPEELPEDFHLLDGTLYIKLKSFHYKEIEFNIIEEHEELIGDEE